MTPPHAARLISAKPTCITGTAHADDMQPQNILMENIGDPSPPWSVNAIGRPDLFEMKATKSSKSLQSTPPSPYNLSNPGDPTDGPSDLPAQRGKGIVA